MQGMIRRTPRLDAFERAQLSQPLTLEQKVRLYDGMFEEARQLGIFPLADPLEGIEEDIHRARIFRSLPRRTSRPPRFLRLPA